MRKGAFICMAAAMSLLSLPGVARAATGTKIVVIVEENTKYTDIVGNAQAPYIASLIAQGALFTNYTAVNQGSFPNYLAMTSGLLAVQSPPSPNIFQAIDATGGSETWLELEESMPSNCSGKNTGTVPGTTDYLYTRLHDPANGNKGNNSCAQHDVPLILGALNPTALPDFTYIVPNQCDDMHTYPTGSQACPAYFGAVNGASAVAMGDYWLSQVVPPLLAQPDVLVILTWDEGTKASGEHIATVEVGAGVTPGSSSGTAYNHYNLEAGLYAALGLGTAPNAGATAAPLPIPFTSSTPAPTIAGFNPTSGSAGTSVVITGTHFTGATDVLFNGLTVGAGHYTVNSDAQITATVPSGASTGLITVVAPGGSATSTQPFMVSSSSGIPTVTSFSPTSGPVGTMVSITGTNFTGVTAVKFNGVKSVFTVNSPTSITATVPGGATTGKIAVKNAAGTGKSPSKFTVT